MPVDNLAASSQRNLFFFGRRVYLMFHALYFTLKTLLNYLFLHIYMAAFLPVPTDFSVHPVCSLPILVSGHARYLLSSLTFAISLP